MDRFKSVKKASILGILGNILLLIIKAIIGFITNSQAMIADAFNSAGDILSSLMTLIGNKISSIPSDDDHNFGHGKAEYIFSMLVSVVMVIGSLTIFKNSIVQMLKNEKYEFSIWLIVVCIITIIIKMCLYIYTNKLAKKQNNILLKANSKDHRNDCLITSLNLISCILAIYNIYFIDGIIGILISIWITITGIKLFIESYDVLMDKSMDKNIKDKVLKIIEEHDEIKKITNFKSNPVGYRYQISFTIWVDGNLSTFNSHEIADKLEKEINKKVDEIYLTVIHVNPL